MSRNPTPGFRRVPRVADRMTSAHHDLVTQSLAAERAGDAARALELHASVPALNLRSRHHVLLAQLADCHAAGGDPVKVATWVAGESGLFHQLLVHELGGLERVVDELATGRLAEHSALARSWVGAPLGGYLVGPGLPGGRLCVEDLAADSWTEVLDLGARANAGDAGWVLGRLVPPATWPRHHSRGCG